MYAVIQTGGKQYQVSPGTRVKVEKLPGSIREQEIVFDKVLLFVSDQGEVVTEVSKLAGIKVKGTVVSEGKDRKILVFKKKSKKDYQKRYGHRQPYSLVEVNEILTGKKQ